MKSVAIMQPTYLPWSGYFNLIRLADYFVFLDDVKLEKSSWQTRNQILIDGKQKYLTVPVLGSRNQLIKDALVNENNNWRKKHINSIVQNYSKHPYFEWMFETVQNIIENKSFLKLSEINIALIKAISNAIEINCTFYSSSDFQTTGQKSLRLIEICNKLSSVLYYSPIGSKEYIEKEGLFAKHGINVVYQNIDLKPYTQLHLNEYISHLSIIDLMANTGFDSTSEYLTNLTGNMQIDE